MASIGTLQGNNPLQVGVGPTGLPITASGVSQSGTTFAAGGEAALAQLIQQLLNGGTNEMQQARTQRAQEVSSVRNQRADYTKAAAMADAQGLISQQQRKALESLVPQLTRAAEGAGTSQSSLRALLLQDAATKAAEASSVAGLKASVDYGNISSQLSGVLEALTRNDNPQTKALLDAINLSKGQQSSSTNASSGGGGGNSGGGVSYQMGPIRASLLSEPMIQRSEPSMSYVAPQVDVSNDFAEVLQNQLSTQLRGNGNYSSGWEGFKF